MRNKTFIYALIIVLVLGAGAYFWLSQYSTSENMVGNEMEEKNEKENENEKDELQGVIEDSDIPGWKTYYNKGLGFTIEVPEEFVVDELIDQHNRIVSFGHNEEGLQVRLKEVELSFDNYFYLDTPLSTTTTIDGRHARVFKDVDGYCDGPGVCTPPFIAYAIKINSTVYNLIFSGEIEVSDLEKEILLTFKLI